jgi:hypothetical protein
MATSRRIRGGRSLAFLGTSAAVAVVALVVQEFPLKAAATIASSNPRAAPPDGFVGKIFGPDVITYQTTYVAHSDQLRSNRRVRTVWPFHIH